MSSTVRRVVALVVVLAVAAALVAFTTRGRDPGSAGTVELPESRAHSPTSAGAAQADRDDLWPVRVRRPEGPPRVDTGLVDALGQPITVSCGSCHATREPDQAIHSGEQLREFHQGLVFSHGGLTCLSCHNPNDYNTLRRVDGASIAYSDVMNLCAQCHAPQARDFAAGAHGGMTGYWDRSRGPQERHNCIDCHDPHKPAFPSMLPTFKPRDRFVEPARPGGEGHVE